MQPGAGTDAHITQHAAGAHLNAVAEPFGFTVALSVAVVVPTLVGGVIRIPGAGVLAVTLIVTAGTAGDAAHCTPMTNEPEKM